MTLISLSDGLICTSPFLTLVSSLSLSEIYLVVLSSAYLLPRGYVNGCVILISYPHLTGFWQVFVILILTSARGILTSAFWKAGCVCVLMCAILILGSAFQLLRWGDRFLFVRSLWFLHWDLQG